MTTGVAAGPLEVGLLSMKRAARLRFGWLLIPLEPLGEGKEERMSLAKETFSHTTTHTEIEREKERPLSPAFCAPS